MIPVLSRKYKFHLTGVVVTRFPSKEELGIRFPREVFNFLYFFFMRLICWTPSGTLAKNTSPPWGDGKRKTGSTVAYPCSSTEAASESSFLVEGDSTVTLFTSAAALAILRVCIMSVCCGNAYERRGGSLFFLDWFDFPSSEEQTGPGSDFRGRSDVDELMECLLDTL